MTTATEQQQKADALVRDTLGAVAKGHISSDKERITGAERMAAALALNNFEYARGRMERDALAVLALKHLCGSN